MGEDNHESENRREEDREKELQIALLTKQIKDLDSEFVAKMLVQLQFDLAVALNKLRYFQYSDSLTEATNRLGIKDAIEENVHAFNEKGLKFSVLSIDLADFKLINDKLGHLAGDEALIKAAKLLKDSVRKTDTVGRLEGKNPENDENDVVIEKEGVVGRMGGDEFVVVLPHTDEGKANIIKDRILQNLKNEQVNASKDSLINMVNFSIGVKEWAKEDTVEGFFKNLDQEMYEQKRSDKSAPNTK